LISHRYHLWSM